MPSHHIEFETFKKQVANSFCCKDLIVKLGLESCYNKAMVMLSQNDCCFVTLKTGMTLKEIKNFIANVPLGTDGDDHIKRRLGINLRAVVTYFQKWELSYMAIRLSRVKIVDVFIGFRRSSSFIGYIDKIKFSLQHSNSPFDCSYENLWNSVKRMRSETFSQLCLSVVDLTFGELNKETIQKVTTILTSTNNVTRKNNRAAQSPSIPPTAALASTLNPSRLFPPQPNQPPLIFITENINICDNTSSSRRRSHADKPAKEPKSKKRC